MVCCSLPECGNTWNVFTVSHGTFTTFPLIFFCPPGAAANTFMDGILGDTNLHSTWCKSLRCCGISGKPIPFAVALGGFFFFFKLLKHVLQIISFPSLWLMSGTHTSTAEQSGSLFLCTVTTLCLYHSWLHTQHLCTGPFPTSPFPFPTCENSLSNHQPIAAHSVMFSFALCHAFVHVIWPFYLSGQFSFCLCHTAAHSACILGFLWPFACSSC